MAAESGIRGGKFLYCMVCRNGSAHARNISPDVCNLGLMRRGWGYEGKGPGGVRIDEVDILELDVPSNFDIAVPILSTDFSCGREY